MEVEAGRMAHCAGLLGENTLKALPYHASRKAFEYTSASCGQHAHHSLPLVQNNNSVSSRSSSPLLNVPPKRPAMSPSVAKKTRKSLTLEPLPQCSRTLRFNIIQDTIAGTGQGSNQQLVVVVVVVLVWPSGSFSLAI
ncbi:hypothetical protein E2C01_035231 [Portunus trituberculatus]|uniref:Uncharacterized protein n=1 Tax=Portunus trituberculatus TaxID=210409 RepID=A0A5B7F2M6_PORTR|nr:hypothetical protein [Portunus trituberculatus]